MLSLYDCIKFIFLPLLLSVSASFGLKDWFKVEAFVSFLFGILTILQPNILGFQASCFKIETAYLLNINSKGCKY